MALIPCPDCGREVSSSADACPQCGYPIASSTTTAVRVLNLTWQDDAHATVNRDHAETLALLLEAVQKTGLKYAVDQSGIAVQGKMWKHNSSVVMIGVTPIGADMCHVDFGNASGHFGPGAGSLTREIRAAIDSTIRSHTA